MRDYLNCSKIVTSHEISKETPGIKCINFELGAEVDEKSCGRYSTKFGVLSLTNQMIFMI